MTSQAARPDHKQGGRDRRNGNQFRRLTGMIRTAGRQENRDESMALFVNSYVNRIDAKGRVSVPADYRAELEGQSFRGIYVSPSPKIQALDCRSREQMEALLAQVDSFDTFSDEQDDMADLLFGEAVALSFDSDGRIMLPAELKEFIGVTDRLAFVGRGRAFQLMAPDLWEAQRKAALERRKSQGLRLPARKEGA